jgi:hypothetical protein
MENPESQNERDARIEQLWEKLDPQKKGELDLHGLQKALRRLDHREFHASLLYSESWSLTAMQHLKTPMLCLKTLLSLSTRMAIKSSSTKVILPHLHHSFLMLEAVD